MIELISGAKWWKFDFHNHTPASMDFGKGDVTHMNISATDWLLMYMRAEIDCVAITDHNSGAWIDKLKEELTLLEESNHPEFRKLYLFPGVEISASGNVHILAIFDLDADTQKISSLLGAVGFPSDHFGTSDAVTDKSVNSVITEIHKLGGIAIPAHVDKACGLFMMQNGHTLEKSFKSEGLLAIEVIDSAYQKPELYMQSKLHLAEVVGTDSHIAAQVGTNYTYVKMGEPSLTALKLALHDKEDAIRRKKEVHNEPNDISSRYFIKSLKIKNGYQAGNGSGLDLSFSPWLTSVIGGRGSGKSSVINYLRIALDRLSEMPSEIQSEFDKFNRIGKSGEAGMLRPNTKIEVEVFKDGVLNLIKWHNGGRTVQQWDQLIDNWTTPIAVTNIKDLFPINIFNQKELYALTGNPSKLLELIDSQFNKDQWQEEKDILVNQWLSQRVTYRQLKSEITGDANIRAELNAINNKIKILESSTYQTTLSDFQKYNTLNNYFRKQKTEMLDLVSQLENFKNEIPTSDISQIDPNILDEQTRNFITKVNADIDAVSTKLQEAINILRPYKEGYTASNEALPWFGGFETAKNSYNGILQDIEKSGSEPYEELIKRRDILNSKLDAISRKTTELHLLELALNQLHNEIVDKEKELRTKRNLILSNWRSRNSATEPFIMIELNPMLDINEGENSFRQLLRKTGGEFAGDIYSMNDDGGGRGILHRIAEEPESSRWDKWKSEINNFLSASEVDKKDLDIRLARHLDSLRVNTPEDIDRLLIWMPEDKLVLKFNKNGRSEDVQIGSAGERTAGMLGLLLALNDAPLIIDQPEDDLDTKLISNFVVEGFKKIKRERQLIVVTHNPNITVNANSDNIVCMNSKMGK